MKRILLAFLVIIMAAGLVQSESRAQAQDEEALWQALRDGEAFAMIRHALAPGTGDPLGFILEDCATQRNLDERGRAQAAEIGRRFEQAGVSVPAIYSSQWCRCLETAELMDLGRVIELPPLNSFFQNRANGPAQTEALKTWIKAYRGLPTLVFVTHQVNITALTQRAVSSGEIYVLTMDETGEVTVLGSIETLRY